MDGLVGSLRQLACCISRETPPLTAESDIGTTVAACSSTDTPQTSEPIPSQSERMKSPATATEVVLSSLESLPVEILVLILAESSLDSLRALINSSPHLYHVYFRNRPTILNKSLKCTLGGIYQDAYAACRTNPWFGEVDAATAAVRFSFRDYHEKRLMDPTGSAADDLSLAVAHKMAFYHLRVVEPLTKHYARWALGALSSSPETAPLSRTEMARVQRAMYRLQIICNTAVRGPQMMLEVLDDFGPWQTEEILCIHEFAKERYTSVFVECAWDLDQEKNPKYRHIPLLDVNESLLLYPDDCINEKALATMLSLGLVVLRDSLEARNTGESAEVVEKSIEDGNLVDEDDWIDGAVLAGGYPQHDRRWEAYSEHDEAQDSRQKIEFEQDDLFSPPLAWVAFWGGRYSNLIGVHVPHALYRWGYVIWDAKRLEGSGAMEYLKLEWQCKYGVRGSPEDDDPRENYCSGYPGNVIGDG